MAKPWNDIGRYGGVGLELVLSMVVLGAIGHWLDGRYWGGGNYGMLGGGLLGLIVGVRNLVRAALRIQKDIEAAEAKDPAAHRWTVDESWLHKDEGSPHDPDDPKR